MIVVSDTSAITSLMQIGREELLTRIYSDVFIPEAVRDEGLGGSIRPSPTSSNANPHRTALKYATQAACRTGRR